LVPPEVGHPDGADAWQVVVHSHPKEADLPALLAELCDAGIEFIIVGRGRYSSPGRAYHAH
jgi:hypothetical protein